MSRSTGLWALLSISFAGVASAQNYTKVSEIKVNHPAFLDIEWDDNQSNYTLWVNSFSPFGQDKVYSIDRLSNLSSSPESLRVKSTFEKINWPNQTQKVPYEVFEKDNLYTIAGGFLVPGKGNGAIELRSTKNRSNISLTTLKPGFFYHKVIWADINNDGRLDVLTARANKPIFGSTKGELLWLEHPENPFEDHWNEHLIATGPDVNFIYEDIDQDGSYEIIATEFFSEKVSLWWSEGNHWKSKVIDQSIGAPFDLELSDLNHDGSKDLLVTNHVASGSVFAYQIPKDFKHETWTRRTLLTNIKTTAFGFNQASPGKAFSFYPQLDQKDQKPSIIVAGDGSQSAYLLTPRSEDPKDWSYQETVILKVKSGVIGQIAVEDVDSDGITEIFVPAYDENRIHIFSMIK